MEPGLDPLIPAPENPLSAAHLHASTAAPDGPRRASTAVPGPFRAGTAAGIRLPVSAGARPVLPAMPTGRTAGRSCPPLNRPVLTLPHGTTHRKVVLHEAEGAAGTGAERRKPEPYGGSRWKPVREDRLRR